MTAMSSHPPLSVVSWLRRWGSIFSNCCRRSMVRVRSLLPVTSGVWRHIGTAALSTCVSLAHCTQIPRPTAPLTSKRLMTRNGVHTGCVMSLRCSLTSFSDH